MVPNSVLFSVIVIHGYCYVLQTYANLCINDIVIIQYIFTFRTSSVPYFACSSISTRTFFVR
uniref:Uncharacterized protein n=1 Tax=Arundo donax TaxID=35708 RepID=A0A0A9EUD3_ARUDO